TNSVFAIDSVAAAPYLPPPPSTTETGTQLPVSRSTAWRKRKMEKAGATEVLFYTENDNSSLCIILRPAKAICSVPDCQRVIHYAQTAQSGLFQGWEPELRHGQ
ncbi:hypothetical protein DPEC_G00373950, partial [Dallia pectoralis]